MTPIYLDYNGTTPHAPEVIDAMRPFLEEHFGNPSSSHWYGIAPKKAVENARRQVADLLDCRPTEIVFTSGGTESNNFAIKGMAAALHTRGNHIITSCIEHPAILNVCRHLEQNGFDVTRLPVDETGRVNVNEVADAIRPDTILISIMHANNEVGTIQPIREIAALAHKHDIVMHTDAAQSIGKIAVDVTEMSVDLLSLAGHKLYAPKGIGALYIRDGILPEMFMHGAGQENGRRAGTENVLEIVGLGKACEIAGHDLDCHQRHMQRMCDRLYDGLKTLEIPVRLNGHSEKRLPNTLSLSFLNLDANRILEAIGLDIAVSAGAACHADTLEISHVLEAMHVPPQWARGTLRFSTGRMTTAEEIDRTIRIIKDTLPRLQTI